MSTAWFPTGWWRAVLADGSVWCESSSEAEVREQAKSAVGEVRVEQHWERRERRWAAPHEPVLGVDVVYVDQEGSDWLALYRDGRKVYEGHEPDLTDALVLLGVEFTAGTMPRGDLSTPGVRGMPGTWPVART